MNRNGRAPGSRFGQLVLKPELACTASCPTFSSRKELHRGADRKQFLAFSDWQALCGEARELGCSRLTISGGEPTLYDRLEGLVALGKGHGLQVDLNSNGSRIDRAAARRLVDAGLDGAVISLYSGGERKQGDYAQGIYRRSRPCAIPSFLALVLANGDVHPCNMVEYAHEPVIGNLRERGLAELWRGAAWRDFRRRGFPMCRYCPMPDQVVIPIARPPRYPLLQAALAGTPWRRLRLGIRSRALRGQRSQP